jgi:DNA-directed RNA polymerase subunit M
VKFCPECGSMMKAEGDEWVCGCGTSEPKGDTGGFVTTEAQDDSDVIETDEDANFEGKPIADDVRCDDCGNGEAWYTIKQTASADEAPTRFFKCTECGHRWREYN